MAAVRSSGGFFLLLMRHQRILMAGLVLAMIAWSFQISPYLSSRSGFVGRTTTAPLRLYDAPQEMQSGFPTQPLSYETQPHPLSFVPDADGDIDDRLSSSSDGNAFRDSGDRGDAHIADDGDGSAGDDSDHGGIREHKEQRNDRSGQGKKDATEEGSHAGRYDTTNAVLRRMSDPMFDQNPKYDDSGLFIVSPSVERKHVVSNEWSGMYKPVATNIDLNPFPKNLQGVLCQVPDQKPTDFFGNKTVPPATCDGENSYTFSRMVNDRLEITDCDGKVFYFTSDGMLTEPQRRAYSKYIDMSRSEQIVVECKMSDGESAFNFFPRIKFNSLAHERSKRMWKRETKRRADADVPSDHIASFYRQLKSMLDSSGGSSISADITKKLEISDVLPELKKSEKSGTGERHGDDTEGHRTGGKKHPMEDKPPNILLVFEDSMSRANVLRSMPETVEYFQNLHKVTNGDYRLYDFQLFNIVGSGTYENAPPILSGTAYNSKWQKKKMELLPDEYHGNQTLRDQFNEKKATTLPSLWDVYVKRGYVSGYVEEGCIRNTGAIARVWNHKVKKDLTQREHRTFRLTAGEQADHSMFNIFCEIMHKMGVSDMFSKSTRPKICFSGRYMHQHAMSYIEDFYDKYYDVPKFALALLVEAHEASALRIRGSDRDMKSFVHRTITKHPNTIVVLFGDHGLGYGPFSKTDAARLEYKLPAMFIMLPTYLLAKYPYLEQNLRENQKRFVTGFDIYHTLVHLGRIGDPTHASKYVKHHKRKLELERRAQFDDDGKLPEAEKKRRSEQDAAWKSLKLGQSLLFPVSVNRTCKDMDIPMEYCSCTNYHTVENAESETYRLLADLTLYQMNKKVKAIPPTTSSCYPIRRHRVLRVQIATTKSTKDKQLIVTFNSRAVTKNHITAETWESVMYQKNTSESVVPKTRIKSIVIGWGWQTTKKIFEKEILVLPWNVGTVWCVDRWHTAKAKDQTKFDIMWISPPHTNKPGEKEHMWKVTDVEIDKSWVLAWQPLTHAASDPLPWGEWTVRIVNRDRGKVIGTAKFYVMKKEYPGIPIATLEKYWNVKKIRRVSAYEKHRKCMDPAQHSNLEFCVCDTSTSWSGPVQRLASVNASEKGKASKRGHSQNQSKKHQSQSKKHQSQSKKHKNQSKKHQSETPRGSKSKARSDSASRQSSGNEYLGAIQKKPWSM